ncbi:hypothetical protein U9M48_005420 [Paspalum notatum var. saurae]|uniref:Uncharacterized protein n=1 Tax=Paspalum notatum var. saurae TaxID=547442 RepID=A0AAQ3PQ63_PASNO
MEPPLNQTKLTTGPSSSNSSDVALPASLRPLHVTDADEEDESVKQLKECLSDRDLFISLQDCLAESNRNWKACQALSYLGGEINTFVNFGSSMLIDVTTAFKLDNLSGIQGSIEVRKQCSRCGVVNGDEHFAYDSRNCAMSCPISVQEQLSS